MSMGILQARILERVSMLYFRGSFQPRDRGQVFPIAGGFHQGSPRILEWVSHPFSRESDNQESIRGLLNPRQFLYQLSYQGSAFVSPIQFCILKLHLHLFICLPFVVDGLFCVSFSVILFSLCMHICVCVCVAWYFGRPG